MGVVSFGGWEEEVVGRRGRRLEWILVVRTSDAVGGELARRRSAWGKEVLVMVVVVVWEALSLRLRSVGGGGSGSEADVGSGMWDLTL